MDISAGTGKTLPELYEALFGSGKPAKAFRFMMKAKDPLEVNIPVVAPLASIALADLAGSQEFKEKWKQSGPGGLSWASISDPVAWTQDNGWILSDLQKWMSAELGIQPKRLSKETSAFLRDWVNTNGGRLPHPSKEMIQELKPFRPEATKIYYRGIRFNDVGHMVQFHNTFGVPKKPFPFESERASSWSASKVVAEKFGRYNASESQNTAMLGWLHRMKEGRDYDGNGGYLIGARISPDQCLVDLSAPGLPFGGGQHGNEAEVILLPQVRLVAKVYEIFGNAEKDIEKYLSSSYENKAPSDPWFFSFLGPLQLKSVQGDKEKGTATFHFDPVLYYGDPGGKTPREISENSGLLPTMLRGNPIVDFRRHLYDAKWISDDTVRYERMNLARRVANRFARSL